MASGYGINVSFKTKLVEVTKDTAIFENLDTQERIEKPYDFLHVVPPMTPFSLIAESGLGNSEGFLDL